MKPVMKTGVVFIDGIAYGITAVSVSEQRTEMDASDTSSGGNYVGQSGMLKYAFSFRMFAKTDSPTFITGADYQIHIAMEAFAYLGTGRFSGISKSGEIDGAYALDVSGNYYGVVNAYGHELNVLNPYFQLWTGASTVADNYSQAYTTPSKQTDAQGRYYQRIISSAGQDGNFTMTPASSLLDKEKYVIGDTMTHIVLARQTATAPIQSFLHINNTDKAIQNLTSEWVLYGADKTITHADGVNQMRWRITSAGGGGFQQDIAYWSLRQKIT